MKVFTLNTFLILLTLGGTALNSEAQTTFGDSLSIQAEATIISSPASITISWLPDADATNFIVYRKLKIATTWGSILATLPSNASQYIDVTVSPGILYDYKIQMNSPSTLVKYGYLSSGIDIVANSNRGIAIVVIENSFVSNPIYQSAIDLLLVDLENDGWFPKTIYVSKTDAVTSVKSQIVSKYNEDALKTKLLLLLGNVPVPYSGFNNPDGHTDHNGAWPTDAFYSEINGNWTDVSVNNVSSANPKNHNVPGDGKYDQDQIPTPVELQVGRIDLSNLPITNLTEEQLLLKYLNKLHRFKLNQINVQERALIDEGDFATFTEGFTQNGYINFSGLVGRNNIAVNDYFTQLSYNTSTTGTYLWSYGCGSGQYTSAAGIGTSSNFATDSLSSVFTMLFGSYFGDWDYQNSFLRMPLTQGNTLTSAWAGRPNWHFYHMAMGENIGYSVMLTQNNNSLYQTNSVYSFFSRVKSINLMGDPSLRNTYVTPPSNLTLIENGISNDLSWTASPLVDGYNIYRRYSNSTDFIKLNTSLISATTYTDNSMPTSGTVYYYVKAVKKKTSPSGSFDNESLGIMSNAALVTGSVAENTLEFTSSVYPNPFTNSITISGKNISRLEIVNCNGAIIHASNYSSINEVNLSLSDLSKGIYFINIISNSRTIEHKKILKLN